MMNINCVKSIIYDIKIMIESGERDVEFLMRRPSIQCLHPGFSGTNGSTLYVLRSTPSWGVPIPRPRRTWFTRVIIVPERQVVSSAGRYHTMR